ncbi:MAG: endonuclease domain-containing protein [Alphaproteobacteria bacterium]
MPPQRPRALRRNATDAEALLWSRLRNRQIGGRKFRRQHPVGPCIADFACPEAMLIVELDGGQHRPETDAARTAYLEARGFTVLRFWNNEALGNPDGVLETILGHLEGKP